MDLRRIFGEERARGKRCFGVVGHPLDHTLSPAMQTAAIKALRLKAVYRPVPVDPMEWQHFLDQARALPLDGFNITLPYKERILSDAGGFNFSMQSAFEKLSGAVNTLAQKGNKWIAANTDGTGFLEDLDAQKIPVDGQNIVLLGAGGAARAILFALKVFKRRPKAVTIINRTPARAEKLRDDALQARTGNDFPVAAAADPAAMRKALSRAGLLINASSAGLSPDDGHAIDFKWLPKGLVVYDLVYHRTTELMKAAKQRGAKKVAGGMGMLVRQGARAFEIWFGQKPPLGVMLKAAREELARREKR